MSDREGQSNAQKTPKMRPIWYFVGWMLLVIGILIVAAGVYQLLEPPAKKPVLFEIHVGIWWGAVILAGGLVLKELNKKKFVG